MKKSIAKKIRRNRVTKKHRGGTKSKGDVRSQYPPLYPTHQPLSLYHTPAIPSTHPSTLPVPTMFSKSSELIFNGNSIWKRVTTQNKLIAFKSNILKLANNQICRNITDQFIFFNASMDRKKVNTECFLLVILSILTNMLKSHCGIIIKGGLAVQFSLATLFKINNVTDEDIFSLLKGDGVQEELSNIFKINDEYSKDEEMIDVVYKTNDIDILIHPKKQNEPPNYYATQISNMLLWLFEDIAENNENIHVISVQDKTNVPEPSKQLIKVSMAESSGSKKSKYTAIIDINIHLPDKKYYAPVYTLPVTIDDGLKGIFAFVSVKPLMLDRLQHIIQYKETVSEIINTVNNLTGKTKISDILGSNPDFKYLMSNYRSTNALIEGLLVVEMVAKKNTKPLRTKPLRNIKQSILDNYLQELKLDDSDKELIRNFLFARIVY